MRDLMPARTSWADAGVTLIAIERPIAIHSSVPLMVYGALLQLIPPDMPLLELRADDWRRECLLPIRGDKSKLKKASIDYARAVWTNAPADVRRQRRRERLHRLGRPRDRHPQTGGRRRITPGLRRPPPSLIETKEVTMSSTALKDAPTGENEPEGQDADKGKLFEVPRVAVIVDDSDPTILKLAFSGNIEIDRTVASDVEAYNKLVAGKTVARSRLSKLTSPARRRRTVATPKATSTRSSRRSR
jgi:hypothetical protein